MDLMTCLKAFLLSKGVTFPNQLQRACIAVYGEKSVSYRAVPYEQVNLEVLQSIQSVRLSSVAEVYVCEVFEYQERLYYAIVEEFHCKTLDEDLQYRYRNSILFTLQELEVMTLVFSAALRDLHHLGFIYYLSAASIVCCPNQDNSMSLKLSESWTCYRPDANLDEYYNESQGCFKTLMSGILSYMPRSSRPSLDNILDIFRNGVLKTQVSQLDVSGLESNIDAKTGADSMREQGVQTDSKQPMRRSFKAKTDIEVQTEAEANDTCRACRCLLL